LILSVLLPRNKEAKEKWAASFGRRHTYCTEAVCPSPSVSCTNCRVFANPPGISHLLFSVNSHCFLKHAILPRCHVDERGFSVAGGWKQQGVVVAPLIGGGGLRGKAKESTHTPTKHKRLGQTSTQKEATGSSFHFVPVLPCVTRHARTQGRFQEVLPWGLPSVIGSRSPAFCLASGPNFLAAGVAGGRKQDLPTMFTRVGDISLALRLGTRAVVLLVRRGKKTLFRR